MKKRSLLLIAVLLALFLVYSQSQKSRVAYPAGRDTRLSFGDGTYQLLTGSRDSIYNLTYNTCLIEQVEDVMVRAGKVYVLGSCLEPGGTQEIPLYAVITLDTNQIALCFLPQSEDTKTPYLYRLDEMLENQDALLLTAFSEFSEEEQQYFQEMEEKQTASP